MHNAYILILLLMSNKVFAIDCEKMEIKKSFYPTISKAFSLDYYENFKILKQGSDRVVLKNVGTVLPCQTSLYQIEVPVKKVILTSSTQLPSLELLSLQNSLIGFQGIKYIYSNQLIKKNIQNVSLPLIPEELIKMKSDLVMTYELNTSSLKLIQQMRKLKIPVVLNNDYQETTPLGRAEWLVYIASFYNKESEAIKIFANIKNRYEGLRDLVAKNIDKKYVLIGDIQNGKWVTCGGQSDLAQLVKDAGGLVLLDSRDSLTQTRSLEDIYLLKNKIDFWLTHNTWTTKNLINKDPRYKKINTNNIYNNNARLSDVGANDYWEMGMARPDKILEDLVAIFHPQLLSEHKLTWYKKL